MKLFNFTLIEIKNYQSAHEVVVPEETPVRPAPTPEPVYMPPPKPEKPPEVSSEIWVPDSKDNDGRGVSFVIHLLTDDYKWMLSRWDTLANGQTRLDFSGPMRSLMNRSAEIICIGASSEEIENGLAPDAGRIQEERRAARRSESIATWVRAALREPVNVRRLNIGHRDPAMDRGKPSDTSDQRRVIIVLVLKKEDGADFEQAFRNALSKDRNLQPIYETILTKYSLTQGLRFHWVD